MTRSLSLRAAIVSIAILDPCTANDTMTEVISGLAEGDVVVTKTIQSTGVGTTAMQSVSGGNRGFFLPGTGGGTR